MVLSSLLVWELPVCAKKKMKSKLVIAYLRQNKKGSFLPTAFLRQIYLRKYF